MQSNIGSIDKIVRIVVGILIGAAGFYFKTWLGLIGIVPILTALINWCPLYTPLKINTKKKD